jgi:hypothetical protein
VRALLARARTDELVALDALRPQVGVRPLDLEAASLKVWSWLMADEHRGLLRLWVEAYARSLVDPGGPWAGFAGATVEDWLALLAGTQVPGRPDDDARRTAALALLRGGMLDLLATGDDARVDRAVRRALVLVSR